MVTKTTNAPKKISSNIRLRYERDELSKNKTKIALPAQYFMSYPGKYAEVLYILVYIKLHIGNDMDKGHYVINRRWCYDF